MCENKLVLKNLNIREKNIFAAFSKYPHFFSHSHVIYFKKYYSGIRKKEILSFATMWVDLESLSKISQTEKDKLYDSTYMWNLKNRAN